MEMITGKSASVAQIVSGKIEFKSLLCGKFKCFYNMQLNPKGWVGG